MNLSHVDIIKKIKNKDHDIITFLFNSYNKVLILGAVKNGLAIDQAESVVQNTWCDFFENAHRFEGRSHIRTYLFGIMKNKTLETFRSNLKYTKHSFLESENDSINPEEKIIAKDLFQALHPDISGLPKVQKEVFIKKEAYGFTPKELSVEYSLSPNHIAILAHRAKNNLKKSKVLQHSKLQFAS